MGELKRGGLLLRVDQTLLFIPASTALRIAVHPEVVRVPGSPAELLGMAVSEGEVLPVVAIGSSDRSPMVVCMHASELVGLVGGTVIGAGIFPVEEAGADESPSSAHDPLRRVSFGGETARTLDIARIFARLRGGAWAGRWGG